MSNIRHQVRSIINNVVKSQDGYHSKVDVLRVVEEEAMLMKETQYTIDMLDSDPMDQFSRFKSQIERVKRIMKVASCSRIRSANEYCRIDAIVSFEQSNNLQLTFRYERNRRQDEDGKVSRAGFHIRYSIEMSVNYQQRENLVVVEVWTANNWPSIQKGVCVNQILEDTNVDDDGWEDVEEEDEDGGKFTIPKTTKNYEEHPQMSAKRQRLNDSQETHESLLSTNETDDDRDEPDSYLAYLDPDILHEFLKLSGLQSSSDEMQEVAAFFLLMTFPFYEQEWDLVGYLLEEIFGDGGEE